MVPSPNRRQFLRYVAAAGGVASLSTSVQSQHNVSAYRSPSKYNGDAHSAALNWAQRAVWTEYGISTEFPEQVVYPKRSRRAILALSDVGESDRIAERALAETVATLQTDTGGFYRFAGDFLGPWVGATRHAVALTANHDVAIDRTAAASFVASHQTDEGGFAPRMSFLGTRLITPTMEATDAAVRALSELGELDEETRAAAASFIREHQRESGGWPNNVRTADATVTGTYFAVSALVFLDSLNDEVTSDAVMFLQSVQQPTGGFRARVSPVQCGGTVCQVRPEVTTTSTAHAVLTLARLDALDSTGVAPMLHVDWLADRQINNSDDSRFHGAFTSYALPTAVKPNYLGNTGLALRALQQLNATDQIDQAAAVAFVESCQHEGSHGLGGWPGYVSTILDTEAAVRTFSELNAEEQYPASSLAETLTANQQTNGAIVRPDYSGNPNTSQTALALLGCARLDEFGALDVEAAAEFIADHQHDDGGFEDTDGSFGGSDPRVTWYAVRALAAVDETARIDRAGVASYFADLQRDSGAISESGGFETILHTHFALEALAVIDRTDAVSVSAAVAHLSSQQRDDGTFANGDEAFHVVLGLESVKALDAIDRGEARQYLESRQRPAGGFASRGFYINDTAMERHAGIVAALRSLGGLRGNRGVPENPPVGDLPVCRPDPEYDGRDSDTGSRCRAEDAE